MKAHDREDDHNSHGRFRGYEAGASSFAKEEQVSGSNGCSVSLSVVGFGGAQE